MGEMYCVDLKKYLNHKFIYKSVPREKTEYGIENMCVLFSNFRLKENENIHGVDFKFNFGIKDNVICTGQEILVDAAASKMHVLSLVYWGDTNEYFKLIYDDSSVEFIKVPFIDWMHEPYGDSWNKNWYGENTSTAKIVMTSGETEMFVHLQHSICEVKGKKKIKKIVLPDNMFLHLFAITLEN